MVFLSNYGGLIAMMAVMAAMFTGLLFYEIKVIKIRQFALSDLIIGFLLDFFLPGFAVIGALLIKILSPNPDSHSIDGKIAGMLVSLLIDAVVGFIVGIVLLARI